MDDATSMMFKRDVRFLSRLSHIQIICGVAYFLWMLVISFYNDLDMTIYGQTNHCSFVHNDRKVKLMSNQPKSPTPEKKVDKRKGKMVMNLIALISSRRA